MSKVNVEKPNILVLEYKQEKGDEDYGSCLWARFTFNLDRYELTITSDRGNYAYKWCETPDSESFLELMARVDKHYLLDKLSNTIFDYEASKKYILDTRFDEPEELAVLNTIFEEIEEQYIPKTEDAFMLAWEEADSDHMYPEIYEELEYKHPADAQKIAEIFDTAIREKIEEILKEEVSV